MVPQFHPLQISNYELMLVRKYETLKQFYKIRWNSLDKYMLPLAFLYRKSIAIKNSHKNSKRSYVEKIDIW